MVSARGRASVTMAGCTRWIGAASMTVDIGWSIIVADHQPLCGDPAGWEDEASGWLQVAGVRPA